jgi:hypothetical protein
MEVIEEFRRQVFDVRDRYYDKLQRKFLEVYEDVPYEGCFEISITCSPDNSFGFEHAVGKFKKSIGKLGFKVTEICDGDNLYVKRLTLRRYKIKEKNTCVIF